MTEHPIFTRVKQMPEPWRTHFPKSPEEARVWKPHQRYRPLAARVLVVAQTRVEGAWSAYLDAVPGQRHDQELDPVLDHGAKLDEVVARAIFPEFTGVPYAK